MKPLIIALAIASVLAAAAVIEQAWFPQPPPELIDVESYTNVDGTWKCYPVEGE